MERAIEESSVRDTNTEHHALREKFVDTSRLRSVLIAGDAISLAIGSLIAINFAKDIGTVGHVFALLGITVAAGLVVLRSQQLFRSRVSSIRVLEITRLTRAAAIYGLVLYGISRITHLGFHTGDAIFAALVSWMTLIVSRAVYRAWVGWGRQNGRFTRKVVIVGSNHEASRLFNLFQVHKEVGIDVVGVLGDRGEAVRSGLGSLWGGTTRNAVETTMALGAQGVIVCPGAVPASEMNALIRTMHSSGLYVHLGLGVSGFDIRRLQSSPLAYEPLMYCEPLTISKWGLFAKRAFDIVAAAFAILLASPIMAIIALAIRLDDGEPVVFRQKRVGQNGVHFGVLKFRTMHVDAEARLKELQAGNERMGPLFKMDRDPRVTRVGRFLRSSSLDELPQLFNVLTGDMSLIGPRPALPSEVETFSDEVRLRERVRPGITGLWQVEARDNPSFDAYQRLDAFYLENWSLLLDLVILIGTVEQVCLRFVGSFLKSRRDAAKHDEVVLAPPAPELAEAHAALQAAVTGTDGASILRPISHRPRHRQSTAHLSSVVDES